MDLDRMQELIVQSSNLRAISREWSRPTLLSFRTPKFPAVDTHLKAVLTLLQSARSKLLVNYLAHRRFGRERGGHVPEDVRASSAFAWNLLSAPQPNR